MPKIPENLFPRRLDKPFPVAGKAHGMNIKNQDGNTYIDANGGAIAMGHPLGATGAMLVSTMLDELERRNLKRAMLSLCVGGGMGISTIIERV